MGDIDEGLVNFQAQKVNKYKNTDKEFFITYGDPPEEFPAVEDRKKGLQTNNKSFLVTQLEKFIKMRIPTSTESFSKVFKEQLTYDKFTKIVGEDASPEKYQAFMKLMMIWRSVSSLQKLTEQEINRSKHNAIYRSALSKTIDGDKWGSRGDRLFTTLEDIKKNHPKLYKEIAKTIEFETKLEQLAGEITLASLPEIEEEEYNKIQSFKLSATKSQSKTKQESIEKLIKPLVREMLRKK